MQAVVALLLLLHYSAVLCHAMLCYAVLESFDSLFTVHSTVLYAICLPIIEVCATVVN